ncbi:MAG: adenosylhomocysteinase [Acidobacteriota bacterium]
MRQQSAPDKLTAQGLGRINWAQRHLHLLGRLREKLAATRPFANLTIGMCMHIEPKTAVLCRVLQAGGAELALTGSPGTTQNDVVAALRSSGFRVFGQREDDQAKHFENLRQVLRHKPHLLLDNGADLVFALLDDPGESRVIGGTEETTTGANRLREELRAGLTFPVIVVNDSPLKLTMENEHGVGPTVVEGFMRATNLLVPARRFVVFGYGSVGRGIAKCLRALGARVAVVEPDSIRALEAALDGMQVSEIEQALKNGEVFITATGRPGVMVGEHFQRLPDGAILINAGHFSWEIDLADLRQRSASVDRFSELIEVFTQPDGRQITLLAQGEMLNLAAGSGNPVETMDLGLALQAQSLRYIAERHRELAHEPHPVPREINLDVARSMVKLLSRS